MSEGSADGSRYPCSVVRFQHEIRPIHPTQKPVELFEYLIRTYTNPGHLVFDNTAGSGTASISVENAGLTARLTGFQGFRCEFGEDAFGGILRCVEGDVPRRGVTG